MAQTANDLITKALRSINAYAPGEVLSSQDANDAMAVLNDMLDTWSNEHLTVANQVEGVLNLTSGKAIYSVGNPAGGSFIGNLTLNSPTITGVTIPPSLIANGDLTDTSQGIPAGTTVLSFGGGTVTMSANATATIALDTISYTVPGDFKITKPVRILSAYTRITSFGSTGIDFPCDVVSVTDYSDVGLKGQPGPWPKQMYYNQGSPLATMTLWPVPTQNGALHIWFDQFFATFVNLTDPVILTQGYARAIYKNLALELCPEYGKTPSPLLVAQARESKAAIKAISMQPQSTVNYDSGLMAGGRDAGFILHGGFR